MSKDVSIDEISERIVNAIIDEPFFKKETLLPKVKSMIRIFVRKSMEPNVDKPKNLSSESQLTHIKANHMLNSECNYWKAMFKNTHPADMERHYKNVDRLRKGETNVY